MGEFFLEIPNDFPLDGIATLGIELEKSGLFVPGYIPPLAGLTSPVAMIYSKEHDRKNTIVLPDRNLVSRIARIAKEGKPTRQDPTSRNALLVMAYCKGMDLNFEPSIAYHELALQLGNEVAREELSWFRAADNHDTQEWIDLAFGTIKSLSPVPSKEIDLPGNLALPLRRWKRNYAAVLKTAVLELSSARAVEKSLMLLDWMERDFIVAGPAAMFAQQYFSPKGRKKRLLKSLRSGDRQKALQGVKNAAWDITHLSDFIRKIEEGARIDVRYIFSTADKLLAEIAPKLLIGSDAEFTTELKSEMRAIWDKNDALKVSDRLIGVLEIASKRQTSRDLSLKTDEIIQELEHDLLSWKP